MTTAAAMVDAGGPSFPPVRRLLRVLWLAGLLGREALPKPNLASLSSLCQSIASVRVPASSDRR